MSNIHPHVRNGGHFYFVSQNKKEEDRTTVPTSDTARSVSTSTALSCLTIRFPASSLAALCLRLRGDLGKIAR